jgi:hypothetical protein
MTTFLQFPLDVEDEWPPVGSESLPFEQLAKGYKCLSAPLFVKDISVGDVLDVETDRDGFVSFWTHLERSNRSTVWLLRLQGDPPIELCLQSLRSLGCNTTGVDSFGCYSIDVPPSLKMSDADQILDELDPELVAIAFPSLRHPD